MFSTGKLLSEKGWKDPGIGCCRLGPVSEARRKVPEFMKKEDFWWRSMNRRKIIWSRS